MSTTIAELFAKLRRDPWRVDFSPEIEAAHREMFAAANPEATVPVILANWIQKWQPCLFGRIAAKVEGLSYCILTEADLENSDELVREKIQDARTQWTADGFKGQKSGFVTLVLSERIAYALPDSAMRQLAERLCFLYLLEKVQPDEIYHDEVFLEKPGHDRMAWKWLAGVNYFCAQGDRRWWQDHRIPGGMAFSTNSVGHMVRSGMLMTLMSELDGLMGVQGEGWEPAKVDCLPKALTLAMQTIYLASSTVSGKATELLPLPEDANSLGVACPTKLPAFLLDKDYCEYKGYYHTDYTIPSEYFSDDIVRPASVKAHTLDLTYLFDDRLDNAEYITMGKGRLIRRALNQGEAAEGDLELERVYKRLKGVEEEVLISSSERLSMALSR